MDHKAWLWRKKSSEKKILATDNVDVTLKRIDEEVQTLPTERRGPETSVKNLNEKLASVILDCHPKDDLVTKHAKLTKDAVTGLEKPVAEAAFLKNELDEALRHKLVANEQLTSSDEALKKCMRRLNFVQEEQEQRICDAVMKTSGEFEKAQLKLEENLKEANKSLATLAAENSHLTKILLDKEKMIEDLQNGKSQAEAEFNALMDRLDDTEKENAFLKYEFRVLEKELEIRNEEMEYSRRSVEDTHKKHLESVRKVSKLEAECQRLRLLMRKKLPGPVALAKMMGEVEILGRDRMEMRRKNMNATRDLIVREVPMEKISLIEQLHDMEQENKTLNEIVTMKNNELQASRFMYSRTASRLSEAEDQLKELCKARESMEIIKFGPISSELSTKSVDNGSEDGISSSGSLANALVSGLGRFRNGKLKNNQEQNVSDMSLMDDFVEMEKLAIVSMETPSGRGHRPDVTSRELVPVVQEIHSKDIATEKSFDWLQVVLNAILKQKRISKRGLDELLEDIKIALGYINHPTVSEADSVTISSHPGESDASNARNKIKKYFGWKESQSENEVRVGESGLVVESDEVHISKEQSSCDQNASNLEEENKKLKDELKSMEARLDSATDKCKTLMIQLRESEENIGNLKTEVKNLKESKEMLEDQIENQKTTNEELDTQLSVSKARLNQVFQKFSSLEVELEYKHNCCEELEATCLELQLQLESVAKRETPNYGINQEAKQSQNGWEITAASVKLAECQETIIHLGKQLKALASPRDASLLDKVFSTTSPATMKANNKKFNRRFSLRDQMLVEHDAIPEVVESPKNRETLSFEETPKTSLLHSSNYNAMQVSNFTVHTPETHLGSKKGSNTAVGSLAIVPSKNRGFGLLVKLFLRRKKGSSKKPRSLAMA